MGCALAQKDWRSLILRCSQSIQSVTLPFLQSTLSLAFFDHILFPIANPSEIPLLIDALSRSMAIKHRWRENEMVPAGHCTAPAKDKKSRIGARGLRRVKTGCQTCK